MSEQQPPDPLQQLLGKVNGLARVLNTPARDAGTLTLTIRNWLVPILGELVQAQQQIVAVLNDVAYQSGRALVLSERNAAIDVIEQVAELVDSLEAYVSPDGQEILATLNDALMFFLDEGGDDDDDDDDRGYVDGDDDPEAAGEEDAGEEEAEQLESTPAEVGGPGQIEAAKEAEDAQP